MSEDRKRFYTTVLEIGARLPKVMETKLSDYFSKEQLAHDFLSPSYEQKLKEILDQYGHMTMQDFVFACVCRGELKEGEQQVESKLYHTLELYSPKSGNDLGYLFELFYQATEVLEMQAASHDEENEKTLLTHPPTFVGLGSGGTGQQG